MSGSRIEELELVLGDPYETDGALSHAKIVEADRDRRLVPWSEEMLDEWGFSAELVPASLGGRWRSTEDLVRRLLPVFRRDPALGLGHGVTNLMAAVNVWVGDDARAKGGLAARLLANERVAVGFHELAHGNDLLQAECVARQVDEPVSGWKIDGRKEVINNIDRAQSALLFVRTEENLGLRSFSLLLWHKDQTIAGLADTGQRVRTAGMRGCQIGIAAFDGLVVPQDALVGAQGDGAVIALRAFQITRAVIPALATGAVDAAIRLAVDYMRSRNLYGGTVWELPHARTTLVRAWGSLLAADAMARAAVRALHLRPDECYVAAATTKYLVPILLNEAMVDLSVLFGSSFYAMSTPYGVFEKWLRDLVTVPIGHAGSIACLLSLIPVLPTWARRLQRDAPHEPSLFSASVQLDECPFEALGLSAGRVDSLTAPLRSAQIAEALRSEHPDLARLLDCWAQELAAIAEAALLLPPAELAANARPETFDVAARLARAQAAGALFGTWFEGRSDPTSPFNSGAAAFSAALWRLTEEAGVHQATVFDQPVPGREAAFWSQDQVDAAVAQIADSVSRGECLGIERLPINAGLVAREREK